MQTIRMNDQQILDAIDAALRELALVSNGHDIAYKALYDLEGARLELIRRGAIVLK